MSKRYSLAAKQVSEYSLLLLLGSCDHERDIHDVGVSNLVCDRTLGAVRMWMDGDLAQGKEGIRGGRRLRLVVSYRYVLGKFS